MNEPTGWICPRCRKANAPWRQACDCRAYETEPIYPQPIVPPWFPCTYRPWPWSLTFISGSTGTRAYSGLLTSDNGNPTARR